MKKLLVIGAGYEQVPAIEMARGMGHYVIASDYDPNAPGFAYGDKSYTVSTDDYEGNLNICINERVDGVLTLISEKAVPVVGRISERLGLPGYNSSTALAATNKNEMHRVMEQANVHMPRSKKVSSIKEARSAIGQLKKPWVLKPSDSSGQRGIVIFENSSKLDNYYLEAIKYSTDKKAVIEEYIEGPEINVTTVVKDGCVNVLSISDRVTIKQPHFGIAIKHVAPPDISTEMIRDVEEIAVRASLATGIKNGITYPQVIASSNGAVLLEIAIRIPGGNMREMALYKSGIDLVEVAILQALAEPLDLDSIKRKNYEAVYIYHFTELDTHPNVRIFNELSGIDEVLTMKGVKEVRCHLRKGEAIPKLNWSGSRFASIIVASDSPDECKEVFERAYSKLKVY